MPSLGQLIEAVHTVVYFAPEPLGNYQGLGLRGYWRGYFASRAAPLGAADAETVTRLFGVFSPATVARSIPDVWSVVAPAEVLEARATGARAALARIVGELPVGPAVASLRPIADAVAAAARGVAPMAAAIAALGRPDEPLDELWWQCTLLREWRGDAHLAAVAAAGLAWPQPDVLRQLRGTDEPRQQEYRGWTDSEWAAALDSLRNRGVTDAAAATALRDEVEAATNERAVIPGVTDSHIAATCAALKPIAVLTARTLPMPNAMGLRLADISGD